MKGRCLKLENCILIEYDGKSGSVSWWARHLGMSPSSLFSRLEKYGDDFDKILRAPTKTRKVSIIEYKGEKHNISQWAKIRGMSSATLAARLANGWPVERALTEEVRFSRCKVK